MVLACVLAVGSIVADGSIVTDGTLVADGSIVAVGKIVGNENIDAIFIFFMILVLALCSRV